MANFNVIFMLLLTECGQVRISKEVVCIIGFWKPSQMEPLCSRMMQQVHNTRHWKEHCLSCPQCSNFRCKLYQSASMSIRDGLFSLSRDI